jgi:4-hydroxy-tetrahydrodipicolinate synthase
MTNLPLEILSAVPTPFLPDRSLDIPSLRALFDRLEPAVDGLFVSGTTGEFPALTDEERRTILELALAAVGPERVVAHVGAATAHHASALTRAAVASGALRVAAITPYFLTASTDGIVRYFEEIVAAARGVAVYAYVFPDVAGTDLAPSEVPLLAEVGVSGIKVSGLASGRVADYVANAPEGFAVWSGNDADLPRLAACGARGTVSGVSAVLPEPFVRVREALHSQDTAVVEPAQRYVEELVALLGPSIARLKAGLAAQGLGSERCRMSIDRPDPVLAARIVDAVSGDRPAKSA